MKKVINKGKRSKTLSEVKPVENISKNPQSFLGIRPMQKEVLFHISCKTMHMSNRMFLDKRKITSHREITRINWVIQVCLTYSKNVRRAWFKERFTFNKIGTKASNICKAKSYRVVCFKVICFTPFDNMAIKIG